MRDVMNPQSMIFACLMLVPMVVLSAPSISVTNSPNVKMSKLQKPSVGKSSAFNAEFTAWADKQDWFALSKTAKFGDFDRDRCAEKGRTFGYSVEFVDSKGEKHILGVGLVKEPKLENQMGMKRNMAEMHAKKSLAMHGQPVSTNSTGRQSRSVSGTLRAMTVLSKMIVRPGTEEKWILCVCTENQQEGNVPHIAAKFTDNKLHALPTVDALFYPFIRCREKNGMLQVYKKRNERDFVGKDMERAGSSAKRNMLKRRMRQEMRKHNGDYWLKLNPEFDSWSDDVYCWANIEEGDVCLIGSIIRVIGDGKTPARAVFEIGNNSSLVVGDGAEFVLQVAPTGVSDVDDLDVRELVLRKGSVDLNLPIDLKDGLFCVLGERYKCANLRGESQLSRDVIACVTGSMELVCECFKFAHLAGGRQLRISSWPDDNEAICLSDYGYGTEILCERGDCNAQLNIEEFVGGAFIGEISKVINSFDIAFLPQSRIKMLGSFSSKRGIIQSRTIQVFNSDGEIVKSIGMKSSTRSFNSDGESEKHFELYLGEGDNGLKKIYEKHISNTNQKTPLRHNAMKEDGAFVDDVLEDDDDYD